MAGRSRAAAAMAAGRSRAAAAMAAGRSRAAVAMAGRNRAAMAMAAPVDTVAAAPCPVAGVDPMRTYWTNSRRCGQLGRMHQSKNIPVSLQRAPDSCQTDRGPPCPSSIVSNTLTYYFFTSKLSIFAQFLCSVSK